MNTPNDTSVPTPSTSECEAMLQKLKRLAQPRLRLLAGLSGLGFTLVFGWFAWDDSVVLGPDGQRVLTLRSAIWIAAATVQLMAAMQQSWLSPKDRLLLLLVEDYLARKKESGPSSPPPMQS
jgi:hypothetical protein